MFSSSKYHYLSGTRGEVDFVEVPSTLFEKFALHPNVVQRYARNVHTGEIPPMPLIKAWLEADKHFKALELQSQIAFALSDQIIHSDPSQDISRVFVEQMEKHTFIPHAKGTSPQLRFQHLVLYPAYYYSYVYAQCITGTLWQTLFRDDPFNRESGKMIRHLLSSSAKKDPSDLLGEAYVSKEGNGSIPVLPSNIMYMFASVV